MGLSARQLRLHVIRPTLMQLGLWSEAAEALVMGTAAHESGGFRFIDQVTGPRDETLGPAFGLYQIEPATHDDLFDNFLAYRETMLRRALLFRATFPDPHHQLATNLAYATAICRLDYYREKEPLPEADDLPGLASYWKRFWNSARGKGTEAQWLLHYREFVR